MKEKTEEVKILENKVIAITENLASSYLGVILDSLEMIKASLPVKKLKILMPFLKIIHENSTHLKNQTVQECRKRFQ